MPSNAGKATRCQFICAALGTIVTCAGADWRGFRGTDGRGIAPDSNLPVRWTASENTAWKTSLPGRGLSAPIIVGNQVFVTCASGTDQDRLHIISFDAQSGREIWHRQFWATGRTMCHPKTCVASSTPTSDGKRIFALFSTNDLACLDLDGNLLWYRGLTFDYPNASNSLGMASSPVVIGETLIVQLECDSRASFAAGIDIHSGENRWKLSRPALANWTSPNKLSAGDGQPILVVLQSGRKLSAHEPATGKEIWSYDEGAATIPSSTVVGDMLYVPSHGLTALLHVPGASQPNQVYRTNRLAPSTPSLLVYEGRVFAIAASILKCGDAKTGKLLWQLRLQGDFTASPVAAGGHIYCVNEQGLCQVVAATDSEGRVVGSGDFGDTILATPAIADGGLFVRSDRHLWKVAQTSAPANSRTR